MQYIYSRVSTDKQAAENQTLNLKAKYPEAVVFEEIASGAKERPVLVQMLTLLQSGDTLIVAALDRLGRKTAEVLALIEDLCTRGVTLVSVRESIDYSTPTGKLLTQLLVSVAEMERNMISERTKEALAAKKAQGIVCGRRRTYGDEVLGKIREMRAAGHTVDTIVGETGVSRARVYQILKAE